ncbi:MAG TPA: CorA family divalent cation transporter [Bauldia sp.]|nr:CorA family divalent cation transporter [Bauldia sp.]
MAKGLEEVLPGLVCGYRFAREGARPIAAGPGDAEATEGEWLWLHVNLADMRCRTWLARQPLLSPSGLEYLLGKDDTISMSVRGGQIWGVFFDLRHELAVSDEDFGPLRFAAADRILVTGRRTPLRSVEAVREQLRGGRSFASPVELLAGLCEQIAVALDTTVERLADKVDQVEDKLIKDRLHDDRQLLAVARLTSVRIHRRLSGIRSALRRLQAEEDGTSGTALAAATAHLILRFDDVDHAVIELRDRARLLQDELGVRLAEQTNRQLRILSVLTALFLPPTLISGLFGMNVTGLPFSASGGAFWWVIGLIGLVCAFTLWALWRTGVLK